jgi:penicillin-binding protein 2
MNRVIQGQYAPGSVFKIVMAIAGLEDGVISPHTTFLCPGQLAVYNTVFRCNRIGGHGYVNVHQALAQSCNVFFYQLGIRLEIGRIAAWGKKLGLGAPTGVDLPHELPGLMPSPEWKLRTQRVPWYGGETVSVAIGQGQVSVTPLQLARLTAVVANGGRLVRPHLLRSVGGTPVPKDEGVDLGLKPETVAVLRSGLKAVVDEGTGQRARFREISVGGKTGSAQVVSKARLEKNPTLTSIIPHGWFVAFAPVEAPRIALAVLVAHGANGGVAAALSREILAEFFGIVGPAGPVAEPATKPDDGDAEATP